MAASDKRDPNSRDRAPGAGDNAPGGTYQRVRDDIMLGELPPGSALVEVPLAKRYAVSRTPVREALRRLEQDGLVERSDRTMRVRQHTPQQIYELYEVRMILETGAAKAAAQRRTDFDIAHLRQLVARMQGSDPDRGSRAQTNRAFHSALWRAAHNEVLHDTLERLYTTSLRHLSTTLADDERWRQSLDEHAEIVEAIEQGHSEQAGQVVAKHLSEARDIRLSHTIGTQ